MNQIRLPLYHLFQRLRKEAGIELDARQYYAFLKSFTSLRPIDNPRQLLELCKIHWLGRPRYEQEFEQLFREELLKEAKMLFEAKPSEKEPSPERKPEPETGPVEPPPPQVKQPPEEIAPPVKEPPLPAVLPEGQSGSIFIQFKTGAGQEAGAGTVETEGPAFLDNDFIFSDKFLPASDRRMKQNWRYLKALAEKAPGSEMDVAATVEKIARNGLFTAPAYQPRKIYRQHILFLIDHGGSMAAFESLSEHLAGTIRESLRAKRTTSLYFHNYPGERLFLDPFQQRPVELGELLQQTPRHSTLAFIISDAGAARGGLHDKRIEQTRAFLDRFRARAPHLLWLNPIPRSRWEGSSAMYLSFFVDMLEASKEGFRKLPEKLKHL